MAKTIDPLKTEARFWARVGKPNHNGCWPWLGFVIEINGFGGFFWNRKQGLAHRYAWELLRQGPTPFCITHTCGLRTCCNPDHLVLMSKYRKKSPLTPPRKKAKK